MSNPLAAATYSVVLAHQASATTARTANLDCQGADYAVIVTEVSAEVNTNSTNVIFQLLESDDTTASNFATFNTAHNVTIDNTAAAVNVSRVKLTGRKRYMRISVTPDTTTNGAVTVSAIGILTKGVNTN